MGKKRSIKDVLVVADHRFGTLQVERKGKTKWLRGVTPAAGVPEALESLREAGARVTLVVPEALPREGATLLKRLLPSVESIVSGAACARALKASGRTRLVVAADRVTRGRAVRAGNLASPHLAVAALELSGDKPRFVRAVGPRDAFERLGEIIPYLVEPHTGEQITVFGVLPKKGVARAGSLGIRVTELALDLAVEDPMLVRLDDPGQGKRLERCRLVVEDKRRALVALPPEVMNDGVGVHGAHGHYLLLTPSPRLLAPAPRPGSGLRRARYAMNAWPSAKLEFEHIVVNPDILRWFLYPCPATAAQYQDDVARYSGGAALDAAGPVASRHIEHSDNGRVVEALLADLNAIGYSAYTHTFTHGGQTLQNVIADLPGTGLQWIRPDIPQLLRDLFIRQPWPDPPGPWLDALRELGGETWVRTLRLEAMTPFELREAGLRIAMLDPSYPWWIERCKLPGFGAEIVILGCHLDSTAALTAGGYDPANDPAPGADDDASGMAATLAVARYMWQFRNTLPHTVRCCFFNAEEQGLVGSRAYAQHLKDTHAPVRAAVCADMIGYNSDANRIFEIHAGHTDMAVRDASVPIATTIASWAATLGALAPAQLYSGTDSGPGHDRTLHDGAIGRSDHASFHEQGYPAVVVSEDFFVNTPTEPFKDPNPDYHEADDVVVDAMYGADITCAIAYAVKEFAGG